jgi:ribosomal protein L30/L7E
MGNTSEVEGTKRNKKRAKGRVRGLRLSKINQKQLYKKEAVL